MSSTIGSGTVIRGSIKAAGDLHIDGHVEGRIEADGEVTIGAGALIKSDVQGSRVTVHGAVNGNLQGSQGLVLEQGARVVGDLSAPTIGIRPGALLRGHVQTGEAAAKPSAAVRVATSRAPVAAAPKTAAMHPAVVSRAVVSRDVVSRDREAPAKREAPAPVIPKTAGRARKKSAAKSAAAKQAAVKRAAPAPVVPALRRGKKAVKRRAR